MMTPIKLPDRPFTWAQAKELGIPRRYLDACVAERRAIRLFQGVYVCSDVELTDMVRAQAAALVTSPFAVLCDRTAAWVHGVDTLEYYELEIPPPLETYVLRGHSRVTRKGCAGGERDLLPRDICVIEGVRVTTKLRTAMDLGCKLQRRDGLGVLDRFLKQGVSRGQMEAEEPRYAGRRGVVQLRQLIPMADPRAESPGESWTRLEILDAGIPAPDLQHWIYINGIPTYRLDLPWPKSKVCVEYDGEEFHRKTEEQREHDRKRRKWLREHGWTVIVVTKDSFTNEALTAWLLELREAVRLA